MTRRRLWRPSAGRDTSRIHSPMPDGTYAADVEREALVFLAAAFRRLQRDGILPRSRYEPWIRVGEHYYGCAFHEQGERLSKAIEAYAPERFAKRPWPGPHDVASLYPHALVEAAVALATKRGEPY